MDESYDQFVGVVAEGRGMSRKRAEGLADGRIYTAKQAKSNGLIDEIATREEALNSMREDNGLESCEEVIFSYEPEFSLGSWLYGFAEKVGQSAKSDYDQMMKLMAENNKFTISYMAEIKK